MTGHPFWIYSSNSLDYRLELQEMALLGNCVHDTFLLWTLKEFSLSPQGDTAVHNKA